MQATREPRAAALAALTSLEDDLLEDVLEEFDSS